MFFKIIPSGTQIDFIGKWRLCVGLSLAVLLLSAGIAAVKGVRFGIDFAGGTELQVRIDSASVGDDAIRQVVGRCGVVDPSVARFGGSGERPEFLIRFPLPGEAALQAALAGSDCAISAEARAAIERLQVESKGVDRTGFAALLLESALDEAVGPTELLRTEFVGPKVGAELRNDGLRALALGCLGILVYVAFRFNVRYAPGAVIALVHDVLVTTGILVMLGRELDLQVLAALLAILGYSINDTIVIYDRIRETSERRTTVDLEDVLNQSVNETLSRTILTSGTVLMTMVVLLVFGGPVIRPFALAMTIGTIAGSYSTVYIASPVLLGLERWRAARET